MKKIGFLCLALMCAATVGSVWGQQLSEKRDVAIFTLNYYGAPPVSTVPNTVKVEARIGRTQISVEVQGSGDPLVDAIFQQAIQSADASIRQVFFDLGRFNIISVPQRMDGGNISAFMSAIQDYREGSVEIPEAVMLGQEAFTTEDLNRLINSYIVVIPRVTYYSLLWDEEDEDWTAELVTNFSIVDVESYRTIAEFSIETSSVDDEAQVAMRDAVGGIASNLDFRLRSIEEFKIQSAILERSRSSVVIEFGRNMGIMVGDEYEVTRIRIFAGHAVPERIALLKIREVNESYSIAAVMWEDESVVAGDQIVEMPRSGADVTAYIAGVYDLVDQNLGSFSVGLKASPNRGFYAFRPVVGFEAIFSQASLGGEAAGFPIAVNLGAEYNVYAGRLRIIPQALFGLIGQIPFDEEEDFYLKGIKSSLITGVSYLMPSRNEAFELYMEGGYEIQYGFDTSRFTQGILLSIGTRSR